MYPTRKEGKYVSNTKSRQGDPLSPTLFLAVLEMIFKNLEWRNVGITINGRTLTHLRFADNIVLFAKTPDDLSKMINDLDLGNFKNSALLHWTPQLCNI